MIEEEIEERKIKKRKKTLNKIKEKEPQQKSEIWQKKKRVIYRRPVV